MAGLVLGKIWRLRFFLFAFMVLVQLGKKTSSSFSDLRLYGKSEYAL
jgi:hypothetical protein